MRKHKEETQKRVVVAQYEGGSYFEFLAHAVKIPTDGVHWDAINGLVSPALLKQEPGSAIPFPPQGEFISWTPINSGDMTEIPANQYVLVTIEDPLGRREVTWALRRENNSLVTLASGYGQVIAYAKPPKPYES